MFITEQTSPEEIAAAFMFATTWTWYDDPSSKTINELCIDAAALAAREVLLNQELSLTHTGLCIETYLDGLEVVKFPVPWSKIGENYDQASLLVVAEILEGVAKGFREKANASAD